MGEAFTAMSILAIIILGAWWVVWSSLK